MLDDQDLSVLLDHTFKSATSGLTAPADLTASVTHRLKMRRRVTTGVASLAVGAACATVLSVQLPSSRSHQASLGTKRSAGPQYVLAGFDSPAVRRAAIAADLPCLSGPFPPLANVHIAPLTVADVFIARRHGQPEIGPEPTRAEQAEFDRLLDHGSPGPKSYPDWASCLKLVANLIVAGLPADARPVPGHDGVFFGRPSGALRTGYLRVANAGDPHGRPVAVQVLANGTISDRAFIDVLTAGKRSVFGGMGIITTPETPHR
jgi:hypothetical protein